MYCNKCGSQIDDNATFCPFCGNPISAQQPAQPTYAYPVEQQEAPKQTNGLAIAGFVLAFLMPLIGFILSIVGLTKAKEYGGNGKGLAIAGIVISSIDIAVYLIVFLTVLIPLFV